jgi:hypothetical protein
MHTGALTPPRIGWRTPEPAQVAACLKESLAGGIPKIFNELGSRRALQVRKNLYSHSRFG